MNYDLVVIGAGPGGYVCAIRAAQLGLKTALVEKRSTLGGTCLNVGCIPSKALLHSTELFSTVQHHGLSHGIKAGSLELDLASLLQRKDEVVNRLVKGVEQLVRARKIEIVRGFAQLQGNRQVMVAMQDGTQRLLESPAIVIATGSVPVELPFLPFDEDRVVHSDQAIAFREVPRRLVVVGGGAIGLELGSVWARLGSEVTIVEFLPTIAAGFDEDIGKFAERIFKKQGLRIETNAKVTGLENIGNEWVLKAERAGKAIAFPCDKVLVSVGRRPLTENLGLEQAGVKLDDRKRIQTDSQFRTSVEGIFAIGDVISGPMLAHKAEEEGVAVAEIIAGGHGHVHYEVIPSVIYTSPEMACVGITEKQAREKKLDLKTAKFPFSANGRAIAMEATEGVVKLLADARTDRLLGAQIVSASASELIAEVVTHLEYGGSGEDLGRTVHAHPTLSEAVKEAGLALNKMAIHGL